MKGGQVSCIGPPGEVLPRVEEQLTGEERQREGQASVKVDERGSKGAVDQEV